MNLTTKTFNEALESNTILIVDFWAEWCGPCQKFDKILKKVSSKYNKIIAKVNVDDNPELSSKYEIDSIPTIIIFENGIPVKKLIGLYSKDELIKEIEGWL